MLIEKVERSVLSNQPRITHFNIKWMADEVEHITDPNMSAILQAQFASNGVVPPHVREEMLIVNANMMQSLPDPFAKISSSSSVLQDLSNQQNYMFG